MQFAVQLKEAHESLQVDGTQAIKSQFYYSLWIVDIYFLDFRIIPNYFNTELWLLMHRVQIF